jgi:hypothetical protein
LAAEKHAFDITVLREFYDSLLDEQEKRYSERFAAQQTAMEAAFKASEEAIKAALLEKEKSVEAAFTACARDAGIDDNEALPGIDEALPPWLRDQMTISRGNNKVWTPDLPIDLLGEYDNPVKGILSSLSPAISGPVELTTGKTIPYGFDQKDGVLRYLMNQTPLSRQAANVATRDPEAGEKFKRYATGPLMTKIVKGPPTREKKGGKSKSSKSKSGTYRYGS